MKPSRPLLVYLPLPLVVVMLLTVIAVPTFAQQKFPAWMDEVDFDSPKGNGFNEPAMPTDPSTGQPAAQKPPHKGFKPDLPDFSKMREKALKLEMEKKQAATDSLEKSYSLSLNNLEQLKTNKTRLEQLLAANPGANERMQLLEGLKSLDDKIRVSEELFALIGGNNASGTPSQAIASLTADQFDRAVKLQKQLFPDKIKSADDIKRPTPPAGMAADSASESTPLTDEEIEARAAELRHRPYRPGRIQSFYIESKKAQKKAAEEGKDE